MRNVSIVRDKLPASIDQAHFPEHLGKLQPAIPGILQAEVQVDSRPVILIDRPGKTQPPGRWNYLKPYQPLADSLMLFGLAAGSQDQL